MATNYPAGLDNLTNPVTTDPVNSPSHAVQHANANDAIEALQAKVGTNNSLVTTSIDYRVRQLEANPVGTANKITQLVINNTGSTLAKGKVVYASGSVGASGQLRVSLSSNAAESTSSKTFGVLAEQIIQGGQGTVVCEGLLENIDTTGANDGDPIWLGTNGSMIFGLANKPVAPAHLVFVGIVVRGGNANNGSIFVKVQNGFELDELHTVLLSSLADKDLLTYDSATGLWKNKTFTTLGLATETYVGTAINNLSNASALAYVPVADVGQPDGVASLDSTGKIPDSQIPAGIARDSEISTAIANLVNSAPSTLDTLNELATALGNDANFSTTITNALAAKAPIASPTFTGTVSGITKSMVGLANVDNTSDTNKPISTATQSALDGKISKAGGDVVTPSLSSVVGLTIKGAASQTGNLLEIQSSAGSTIGRIAANGDFQVGSANLGRASIFTDSSSKVVLGLRAATSQNVDIQQFINGSGSILGGVNAIGQSFIQTTEPITSSAVSQSITSVSFTSTTATYTFAATSQTISIGEYVTIFGISPSGYNGSYKVTSIGTVSAGSSYSFTVANTTNSAVTTGTGYFFPSASVSISTQNKAHTGLIIKAVSGQTASTMEIQNSLGQPVTWWDSNGGMTASQAVISTLYSGGFMNTGNLGYFNATTFSPSVRPIVVRGAASQTANLTEWQDSSGTVLAKVDSSGIGTFAQGSFAGGAATIDGGGGAALGAIYTGALKGSPTSYNFFSNVTGSPYATVVVKGLSGQTTNLQEWQNSAGTVLSKITSDGQIINDSGGFATGSGYVGPSFRPLGYDGTSIFLPYQSVGYITVNNPGYKVIAIRGAESQTANLTEWQDSAGNVLTGISSNGLIYSGKSYSSYNIESAGTLASSESIANTFNLQGKNNLLYPSTITNVGGNGWTSVTPNYGIAPDGTQTSTRYVWNSQGNCYTTPSISNYNTYAGEIYTVSAYIKINAGTGSCVLRYSKGDSSKVAGVRINLSTKTATAAFDASDYNVLSYYLIPIGKNWYRAIATIKVLVGHTNDVVMFAATDNVGDVEVWGFQLERGLSASPLTPTTNAFVTTVNTLNIPYGQINLQSDASTTGIIIRGQSGQTADLQQWQNSSGTVLAKITSTGAFDATAITVNGSPISGGGLTPFSISSNTGLSSNSKYFVNTSAARTLTLPASPSVGDEIQVFDASNLAGTNNVTISSNGGKINGSVQDAIVDVNGGAMVLIYTGSTYGWRAG